MAKRSGGKDKERFHPRAIASALLPLLLFSIAIVAQSLEITSSADRRSLRVGESLVFTLRLKGPGSAIVQPPLPPIDGLKLQGQYQTVETSPDGGRIFAYHYLFSPTRSGHIVVPDLSLRIGGQTRTAPGFEVEVEQQAEAQPPRPVPVAPAAPPPASEVYLSGELSAPRAYVGQPVTYTLHLITHASVRNFEITRRPDFQGFRKVEAPEQTPPRSRPFSKGGLTFLDVTVLRYTLFPIEQGALKIDPFEAVLRVESREAAGRVVTAKISGGQAELQTISLPSAPPGFCGAVGSFTLKLESGPPQQAAVGQPFTLGYRVEGSGFLPDNPVRWSDTPFFATYPATSDDQSAFMNGAFVVKRVLSLSLLPKLQGDAVLPKATLTYFDPGLGRYQTAEVGGARLLVRGTGLAGGQELALAPLIAEPRPSPPRKPILGLNAFLLLLAFPFLASALLAAWLWLYRTRLASPERIKARALMRAARHHLRMARKNLDVRRSQAFHAEAIQALYAALNLMTGRPAAGLTRAALSEAFAEAGLSKDRSADILAILDQLEAAEFAGDTVTKRELAARYEAVRRLAEEAWRG
jgi:hypothetical protein